VSGLHIPGGIEDHGCKRVVVHFFSLRVGGTGQSMLYWGLQVVPGARRGVGQLWRRHNCSASRVAPPAELTTCPTDRAVLGLVCLPTDQLVEEEVPAMLAALPAGRGHGRGRVGLRIQRLSVPGGDAVDASTFATAAHHINAAAAHLRPTGVVTALSLSCTSMSMTIGDDVVKGSLCAEHPDAASTTMAESVVRALEFRNVKRCAVLTPYEQGLHESTLSLLHNNGISTPVHMRLDLVRDVDMSAVSPSAITACVQRLMHFARTAEVDLDGVLVCCSALRTCEPGFLDALEAETRVPVVSSQQAQLWHLLRLAGVHDPIPGFGSLLRS